MTTSSGTVTLIPPTHEITETGQRMNIDGLDFEFQLAPDTEAPAEMHWYIEQLGAVCAAENCCHTLHNTYTLRGAPIRDPQAWSKYLQELIDRWGDRAEVMYGMHHWPVWGNDRVVEMLTKARDGYRYINDQTLRLANHGFTPVEIAEQVEFPPELADHWAMRPYYGSVNHNVKATYSKYLGWFDGNPANLHTHPPEYAAKKYVEMMGGADAGRRRRQGGVRRGRLPVGGRGRQARRVRRPRPPGRPGAARRRLRAARLPGRDRAVAQLLPHRRQGAPRRRDAAPHAEHRQPRLGAGDDARHVPRLPRHPPQRTEGGRQDDHASTSRSPTPARPPCCSWPTDPSATPSDRHDERRGRDACRMARAALDDIILGTTNLPDSIAAGTVELTGNADAVHELVSLLDTFEFWFNIVTP